ncbi:hypothetical protein CEXT_6711 [Caerostris extrusa]|uniref:Uncharacterized protein n=1 Tax=Caerostris extrusa TaxID=172846 RepID=A0AAV4MHR2_CAEEX|nr:hypothetical protein CEXT_6711 [Caerostris extrusa]
MVLFGMTIVNYVRSYESSVLNLLPPSLLGSPLDMKKGWGWGSLSSIPLMPRDAPRFGPHDGFICVRDYYPRHISVPTPFLPDDDYTITIITMI